MSTSTILYVMIPVALLGAFVVKKMFFTQSYYHKNNGVGQELYAVRKSDEEIEAAAAAQEQKEEEPFVDTFAVGDDVEAATVPVIVIGGGGAGMATAAALKKKGITSIVFEKQPTPGYTWHTRYDRLHLHTHRNLSNLPFLKFPPHYPEFPSRDQVHEYLVSYAHENKLDVRCYSTVLDAAFDDQAGDWVVKVEHTTKSGATVTQTYRATRLVIACGICPREGPKIPDFEGLSSFQGETMHSVAYSNGARFRNKKVLVVGYGNSGAEISMDLWEHGAKPSVLVRSPVLFVPRVFLAFMENLPWPSFMDDGRVIPAFLNDIIMRIVTMFVPDLSAYGLHARRSGCSTYMIKHKVAPMLDVGTIALIKKGEIKVLPKGVSHFTKTGVVLEGESDEYSFDAVVFATGYDSTASVRRFLRLNKEAQAAFDERQANATKYANVMESFMGGSGRESAVHKQLYFVGYNDFLGLLHEMGREALMLANDIAKEVEKK